MPISTKNKQRAKAQTRIYEHTENIEPVATRHDLTIVWRVMTIGFTVLTCLFVGLWAHTNYLHGDLKEDMRRMDEKIDKRMDKLDKKMDGLDKKMDGLERLIRQRNR